MKGIVLGFDESKAEGKIRGEDENRYRFVQSDFNAEHIPLSGTDVDFDIEDGMAKDIYILQKATPQGVNLQGMQAKAANIVGNISNNEDVLKVRGTMTTGFANAPVAIVALLLYGVATSLTFASLNFGWIGFDISLFDTDIGKAAFVLDVLLVGVIISDVVKAKRTVKFLGAIALLILPFIALYLELDSMGSRVNQAFTEKGTFGIGFYLIIISSLTLLFSPIKKQGESK